MLFSASLPGASDSTAARMETSKQVGNCLHLRITISDNTKNVFPTGLLNDCAVYSGHNEVKDKSCLEFLLILYQLTSIALDLCQWLESYWFKGILIWQWWLEFHLCYEVIFMLNRDYLQTYSFPLCIFYS